MRRAGFGPSTKDIDELEKSSVAELITHLLNGEEYRELNVIDHEISKLGEGKDEAGNPITLTAEQRAKIKEYTRGAYKKLNLAWLDEMTESKDQLREKMAFFWHGHFASRSINIFYQQQLLNIFRQHGLGDFKTLLVEASKSASIVNFLNNNQNRKGSPNENFARELMELFTLGLGHYTEEDVKEAARAFTGWGVTVQGEFVFRKVRHDSGVKTFLGKTGNFDGFDIINIILEKKQCACFITQKICKFFVGEQIPDDLVRTLSERFYEGGYNIRNLMLDIFSSDWFYSDKYVGTRIKSPVELLVGIRRALPMKLENPEIQILLQQLLGQELLFPPNVAGWPGGKAWIDGASILLRLNIPKMIALGEVIELETKGNDDVDMGMANQSIRGFSAFRAAIDWTALTRVFNGKQNVLKDFLIPDIKGKEYILNDQLKPGNINEEHFRKLVMDVMSTPEYQLC